MNIEITADVAKKVLTIVDAGLVRGLGQPEPGMFCVEAAVCYALDLPHGDSPACVAPPLRSLKIELNDSNWSSNAARAKGLRRLAVAQLGSAGTLDEKEFVRRVIDVTIRKTVPTALKIAATVCKDHKHKAALMKAAARCESEGTIESSRYAKNIAYAAASADAAAYTADAAAYAAASADASADAAAYTSAAYAATSASGAADAAYAAASADAAAYAYTADAAAYAAASADAFASASAARDKLLSEYAEDVVRILIDMGAPGCQWLFLTEDVA